MRNQSSQLTTLRNTTFSKARNYQSIVAMIIELEDGMKRWVQT